MRIVIQRTTGASVSVDENIAGSIGLGLMVLVGVEKGDTEEDAEWLAAKTVALRIFDDADGIMNLSVKDVEGDVLSISQFTLTASTRKGNRPGYSRAAGHETATRLYDMYSNRVEQLLGRKVARGIFGADMKVELINSGPVTIIIDSRLRE